MLETQCVPFVLEDYQKGENLKVLPCTHGKFYLVMLSSLLDFTVCVRKYFEIFPPSDNLQEQMAHIEPPIYWFGDS